MQGPWHELHSKDVLGFFNVEKDLGRRSGDIASLQRKFGKNALPEPRRSGVFAIFLRQFLSPLIYVLSIAAVVAFSIGNRTDAFVIVVVVFLNSFFGAVQEGRAEASLAALRRLFRLKARVIRDGEFSEIEAIDLVPGDIFQVSAGDAVPTDGRIIEACGLQAAEATLTGESIPVPKLASPLPRGVPLAERSNMLFAGTHVTSGRATLVAVATGEKNEIGRIAQLAREAQRLKTPLELRLQGFGRAIAVSSVVIFVLVLALGLLHGIGFSEIFMVAVSQLVSLVPEGLPVATTAALAIGVQRMAHRRTIVRKLSAVETLGCTTIICADKTGTLTRNEMTVVRVAIPGRLKPVAVGGIGYIPVGEFKEYESGRKVDLAQLQEGSCFWELMRAAICCNDSRLVYSKDESTWKIVGDPTEGALLVCAAKAGIDVGTIRHSYPRKSELPFDPAIKMMATEHEVMGRSVAYVKGAPEAILPLSVDNYGQGSNEQTVLDLYQEVSAAMAAESLRVLVFGAIEDGKINGSIDFSDFRGRIKLLGVVGQLDPPRFEVPKAVAQCKIAGIRPIMITGDHKSTALAVAKNLGIATVPSETISGSEIEAMTEGELASILDDVSVFARVRPEQKLKIVKAFQNRGHVVAMTGDGVNDVPALVQSDVGVAMGRTGAEVAKEASKIVVTDDNFATIVTAVAEGRLVHQNIKKLLLFLFVTSLDEVLVLSLALLFGFQPPLEAVQILWINLVSETALTANIIMEPMEGDEMRRQPTARAEPLLDREMIRRMPLMIGVSVLATFGWFWVRSRTGVESAIVQSETFTVLVVCQWFNLLNCRSAVKSALSGDILKNRWLIGGLITANILHGLVIYWEPLSEFFRVHAISSSSFFAIGIVSSFVLWSEELRKFCARRRCREIEQT